MYRQIGCRRFAEVKKYKKIEYMGENSMQKYWKKAYRAVKMKKRCYREKVALYRLRKSPEFKYLIES